MGALEVHKQLLLFHIGNSIIRIFVRKSGFLHLCQQGFYRTTHSLGQLFDGHFCHLAYLSASLGT